MPSPSPQSVSILIDQVKAGSDQAAALLWNRYYQQLMRIATKRLGRHTGRYVDEEDVVIQAFASFCRRAEEGQFPDLRDRDDLWRLLMRIVECKALNQHKHLGRAKNRAIHEAQLMPDDRQAVLDQLPGVDVSPEYVLILAEELRELLDSLDNPVYQQICVAKLEGLTNDEIAEQQACSVSSVERKLRMIRGHLKQVLEARRDETC